MPRTTRQGLPAGVKELRRRIERWRRTRERRTAMPAELWTEAVALAGGGRAYAIGQALGLNFEGLKRRMAEAGARAAPAGGTFVELSGAQILGASSATGAVVELSDGDGVRLTVRLAAGADVDVARLVAAFRQRGT